MLIDWFTVVAQVVNFLLLVWLLKRFLFKPILSAMNTREQKITAQLRNAEEQQAKAKAEAENFRIAREELDRKRQTLIQQSEAEAEALRRRLTEDARREVESLRSKWRDLLRDEQAALSTELGTKVQQGVFSICRQVLRELAGADLEQQIVKGFVCRLQKLDDGEKKKLGAMLLEPDQSPLVRSAFALPAPFRKEIESAINGLQPAGPPRPIRYEIVPDLMGGIELATDGRKVSWSIAGYLSSLEQSIRRSADGEKAS